MDELVVLARDDKVFERAEEFCKVSAEAKEMLRSTGQKECMATK